MATSANSPARLAPGGPGIPARWTSSAKTGVGTALSEASRVWFTLSHGIFNEIYYPRVDQACVRDMGLIVTDGAGFFSEEKRDADSEIHWLARGVPAFRLVNTCRQGRYQIEKQIVTDPARDTLLQRVRFEARQGRLSDYRMHVLLAPHLANRGAGNTGWVGDFEGAQVLFAARPGCALALACSVPWAMLSAGYVGVSDGWQDLKAHGRLTWEYTRAEDGNVALTAEIELERSNGDFSLALGFGADADEAARNAVASLRSGFDAVARSYIGGWQNWIDVHTASPQPDAATGDLSCISLSVLRAHQSKSHSGAVIASLSIPWGFNKGDDDLGGYHLVWSRDMVETAGGLLAAGAHEDVRLMLGYLRTTQQDDGHWPQNMWLDGSPYWNGIQMDQTALPILLLDLAGRERALSAAEVGEFWPMVKRAAGYLARVGPVSQQDRWEEDPGYSPFTVAAEIAALLAAADLADASHEADLATYLRETADIWNASIDRWMYATGTDWCEQYQIDGYYVRIAPLEALEPSDTPLTVQIKNVALADESRLAVHLISPDALALVRFGLRAPDDPRIRDTVKIIDALLKVETPSGVTWHRYNGDGYGEHEDGSPFDGTGIGRGWPLLTGERAHYELAAGDVASATRLRVAMETLANEGGLISEQVWDAPDVPERELRFGRPSGSAMPLAWAHAEYLKLRRSLRDGQIFDLPPQTVRRYMTEQVACTRMAWQFNHKLRSLPAGKTLRIQTQAEAVVHWSADDWQSAHDVSLHDTGIGIHFVDLPTESLSEGAQVKFTFHWQVADRWEGEDFVVRIG